MENELEKVNNKVVEMAYKSLREVFVKFEDFNKFDDFIESCLKQGKNKVLSNIFSIKDYNEFDIHKSLWENTKNVIIKQMQPKNVKLNMAIMFAYNLNDKIVINSIKNDEFVLETIKKELIDNELFEELVKLKEILNK